MPPAGEVALLILGVLLVVAIVTWYGKNHIHVFANALLAHRQQRERERTTDISSV